MAFSDLSAIVRKHPMVSCCLVTLVGLAAILGLASQIQAEQFTFTLDQAKSIMVVSGGNGPWMFEPQDVAPGGDTAHYMGEIVVDMDSLLAPTQIAFVQALMEADVTGDWLPAVGGGDVGDPDIPGDADPGDPAPGNYGLFLDAGAVGAAWGAFRDLGLSVASEPQLVTNGSFNDGQKFTVVQGTWETTVQSPVLGDAAGVDDVTNDASEIILRQAPTAYKVKSPPLRFRCTWSSRWNDLFLFRRHDRRHCISDTLRARRFQWRWRLGRDGHQHADATNPDRHQRLEHTT